MLDVRCEEPGQTPRVFSVYGFAKLDEVTQEQLRQSLFCLGCGARAYFRRASSDGKAACFGSLYHSDDCPEYRPSSSSKEHEADIAAVREAIAHEDGLSIDFDAPVKLGRSLARPAADSSIGEPQTAYRASSRPKPQSDSDAAEEKETALQAPKLGLKKLLLSLLRGSELAGSDLWVYTDEVHRWRAKNLFVNFADAIPTEKGAPRMYWGTLSHADKDMNWLNPTDSREVGIAISDIRDALLKRFGIKERGDFEGAGIILFGKCFYTKDKQRKIIKPWSRDPKWVYLLPGEE
ncbi:hypothetical protein [Shewanella litorisediminis]|uniref:Uncharacterized protein n=1 Tax=Shewanella litorisediminis TaxID=1173586 RepID=A0ABX7G5E1_9GAMM|nr:hypothetical protein [Shewanella litorisediminis]MCL2918052.1 hypothetical protein [Shewanella litorisediminis]QRH02482.1 hypothetical protein JQC75_03380 [Shewanella litorisediminis]